MNNNQFSYLLYVRVLSDVQFDSARPPRQLRLTIKSTVSRVTEDSFQTPHVKPSCLLITHGTYTVYNTTHGSYGHDSSPS